VSDKTPSSRPPNQVSFFDSLPVVNYLQDNQ
jgi:hypothetical protein